MTNVLDKISDDFQSTFTEVEPGVFSNLFFEHELPVVESIFKKHMGDDITLNFIKQDEVSPGYFIWVIEVKNKYEVLLSETMKTLDQIHGMAFDFNATVHNKTGREFAFELQIFINKKLNDIRSKIMNKLYNVKENNNE